MLAMSSLAETIKEVGVSAVVVDRSGLIVEISDGWTSPGAARGVAKPGKSYFETCIRPDRHSLELIRGFKNLAENTIDFFATVSWREEAGERKHFLIVATPRPDKAGTILVLHIDLSVLLRGRHELSALMIGQGPAAFAQMEAAMLGVVRGAIAEALATPQGKAPHAATTMPRTEERALDELTRPQIELLSYLANGLSNQQIAKERGMSVNTVKSQVANIIQKLNVTNRTQAALFAVRHGAALGLQTQG